MTITITRTAPPDVPTGVVASAVSGFDKCYNEEFGVLVNRTTEFETVGNDIEIFTNVDDYVYFSTESVKYGRSNTDGRITAVHIVLSQLASSSILPIFEYNTGDNTWSSITADDGTNGFTQNGTISFANSSMPSYSVWKLGSQDGNGVEIGDGVDRRYIRIKRTAATLILLPKISESGIGELSPSTTYYYSVASLENASSSYYNYRRSAVAIETSGTTTAVKRTIKISWDTDLLYPKRTIWRTAISGNYSYSGNVGTYVSRIDTRGQSVKSNYFDKLCGNTETQNYVLDDGNVLAFIYNSTYGLYSNYMSSTYFPFESGELLVSGGVDSNKASFSDILNYDKTLDWNTFTRTSIDDNIEFTYHNNYRCNDILVIDGYFQDKQFTLDMYAPITTLSTSNVLMGNIGSSVYPYYWGICNIILHGGITDDYYCQFRNSTFYACNFITAAIDNSRNYTKFPQFGDNCELYNCQIETEASMESPSFYGSNIILENVLLSNPRYGLEISEIASQSISINGFSIQGGSSGIYITFYTDVDITLKGIKIVNITNPIKQYSKKTQHITIRFTNLEIIGAYGLDHSLIGNFFELYRNWEFDTYIKDSNGNPIKEALITFTDIFGNTTTAITNIDGEIDTQIITEKKYFPGTLVNENYGQYYADDIIEYNPYTITVSKSGYVTKTTKYLINKKISQIIFLENRREV